MFMHYSNYTNEKRFGGNETDRTPNMWVLARRFNLESKALHGLVTSRRCRNVDSIVRLPLT